MDRRQFLSGVAAAGAAVGMPNSAMAAGLVEDRVPTEETIFHWIEEISSWGVRRPAYPADLQTEDACLEKFTQWGLESVRREPVELLFWKPEDCRLEIRSGNRTESFPCFAVPYSASCELVDAEIARFDERAPTKVTGKISLGNVHLMRSRKAIRSPRLNPGMVAPDCVDVFERALWQFDPDKTLPQTDQILPFSSEYQWVMEPSMEGGALGFVGVLADFPGGQCCEQYVPYDAMPRAMPGAWISAQSGQEIQSLLAKGPVKANLRIRSVQEKRSSHNIVGELPGSDDELVIVGSHHDGPWSSAVEDASGVALVLAQARYWSQLPASHRPHRMLFLLNAGHMAGGAGTRGFIGQHQDLLSRVVLEIHLEHAAAEFKEQGNTLVPTGLPEVRWWFTSKIARLRDALQRIIVEERLDRSLILAADAFAVAPPTDGGLFHLAKVPIVNFLTAPFYLFASIDTLDKIHKPSLVPLTRATIHLLDFTRGVSAKEWRQP